MTTNWTVAFANNVVSSVSKHPLLTLAFAIATILICVIPQIKALVNVHKYSLTTNEVLCLASPRS